MHHIPQTFHSGRVSKVAVLFEPLRNIKDSCFCLLRTIRAFPTSVKAKQNKQTNKYKKCHIQSIQNPHGLSQIPKQTHHAMISYIQVLVSEQRALQNQWTSANQPTNQPLLPVPGLIETGSAPSIAYLYQNPFLYRIIPARYGLVNLPVGTVQ